jgi:hypothetical protein
VEVAKPPALLTNYSSLQLKSLFSIMYRVSSKQKITNNVPVVFMVRYIMVLRGATSLLGAFGRGGP